MAISEKSLVDTSDFHHRADVELFRALKLSVARENEYSHDPTGSAAVASFISRASDRRTDRPTDHAEGYTVAIRTITLVVYLAFK